MFPFDKVVIEGVSVGNVVFDVVGGVQGLSGLDHDRRHVKCYDGFRKKKNTFEILPVAYDASRRAV